MPSLSKSKLISFRQCAKRLWLEVNRPDLCENSARTEASFAVGNTVGAIAQRIFDPEGRGIEVNRDEYAAALAQSQALLAERQRPVFEAGVAGGGAVAFADIMLPHTEGGWKMIEVKSSTSVKDYHRDDVAIQSYAARAAGIDLRSVGLAHIDSTWTYPGDGDYRGLLHVEDLSDESAARAAEVESWIADAQKILASPVEPAIEPGAQCESPYACGFCNYCHRNITLPEYPLGLLPRLHRRRRERLINEGIEDLRNVPDDLLNPTQLRVKQHTLANTVYFDAAGAATDLADFGFPARFLDFETVMLAVPIWAGTRPYQQIPFQFSVHTVGSEMKLAHCGFLDLSGEDPSRGFAHALVEACGGDAGPIFVYNATFECSRISELAERFADLAQPLHALIDRIVDLLPIARDRYYHPAMRGSWSIKDVLPAAIPELSYDALDGVNNGDDAMAAFAEAIAPETTSDRRAEIQRQLQAYCRLDTFAMVRLWQFFRGDNTPLIDEPAK